MNLYRCFQPSPWKKRKLQIKHMLINRPFWDDRQFLKNTIMRTNLITLVMLISCIRVTATVYAQGISLFAQGEKLEKLFTEIKKQSGYTFLYETKLLDRANKVTVSLKNATLQEALEKCFQGQPLTFEIVEKMILVKAKEKTVLDRISNFLKSIDITGKILDEKGQPLPGASVKVKGTNLVTLTKNDGSFVLNNVPETATLIITYIGYQTQEIVIKNQTEINLTLKEIAGQLNDLNVVSTGFEQLPKERATGSFATVGKQQLERQVSTDIISRLEGVANGVVFNIDGSGRRQIRVRGQNTIFANAEPLIVVDNFPYEGSLDNINPNDVESITVLKDAAAASIWGVRAGNGVIVITTKKGKLNQSLNIGFNSNLTVGNKPDVFYDRNFLNANDYISVEQQLFSAGYYNSAEAAVTKTPLSPVIELLIRKRDNPTLAPSIDAQIDALRSKDYRNDLSKYFYQNNINQQYALSFNGGTDKMTYYISGGLDQNRGNTVGQNNRRYSFNAQTSYSPIKNLDVNIGFNYIQGISKTDNVLSQFPQYLNPYMQLVDGNGNPLQIVNTYRITYVNEAPSKGFLDWSFVPLREFGKTVTEVNTTENRFSPTIRYTFTNGLSAEVCYQYQKQTVNTNNLAASDSFYARNLVNRYSIVNTAGVVTGYNIPTGAILTFNNSDVVANNLRTQLNYTNTFGHHSVTGLAGYEIREVNGNTSGGRFFGYDPDVSAISKVNALSSFTLQPNGTGSIPYNDAINATTDRFLSWYANGAYTFKNRYTLSASGRVDAANYFGIKTNQKFLPLWSAGLKWDVNQEDFFKVAFLPKLSLRATYGYNGNIDRSLSAFTTANYINGATITGYRYATITNPPNPELRWERTSNLNFGLDFTLLDNSLSGSIDYFERKGRDMIGDAELAPSTGTTSLRGNFAQTRAHGVDVTLNATILKGIVGWQSSVLFSYAKDIVTGYSVDNRPQLLINGSGISSVIYPKVGYPVYGIYSYKWAGLDPATGDPRGFENGVPSTNYSILLNPLNFEDINYHGPAQPKFFGGFQNTVTFKQFALSFQINYKFGHFFNPRSIYYNLFFTSGRGHSDYVNRWQHPGDEALTNVPSFSSLTANISNRDNFYNSTEVLIQKADHIRLQDVNFSYTASGKLIRSLGLKSLNLFVYARNLGLLWKANHLGLDPDYAYIGAIPLPKNYSVGLRANF